ncbi:MAG: carboxypeptidase M32 [Gemmataceae bacterium]
MNSYDELIKRWKDASVLGSCGGVLGWDERTYMPRNGSAHRGEQMAIVARLCHEMTTQPKIGELLTAAEASKLDEGPAANVREIRRAYNRAVKLPPELVEELARVTTQAQQAWTDARAKSDFALFRPWLEKIVALKRREADAVGFKDHPYDALIDEFEPGTTTAAVRKLFADLAADLTPLVARILGSSRKPNREILHRDFPVDVQEKFGRAAAEAIGFDFNSGRLDVTTHPFCSGLGPGDVRITTRYNKNHFNESFFGVLHECGHGIYEQNLPAEHYGTPLGSAASLGIHESQSRLWENQVGRSRPFWEHFFPKAQAAFPAALSNVKLDDFLFAISDVQASFIRVEADEATYNLHIIVRFELEQALMSGDLKPADVPGAWNDRFRKMFNLTPANDAQGCLQDIHWSFGGIGYFPTYTLGNLYAAQFMEQARKELGGPELDADFHNGKFGRLKEWLAEKIHRHGQRYRANVLCERITSRPLSHKPFIEYLRTKYAPLYGV